MPDAAAAACTMGSTSTHGTSSHHLDTDLHTLVNPHRTFKLVATDLDGTFLGECPEGSDEPNYPTEENKQIFTELDRKGVHLAMISGRCYTTTSVMMDHCGLDQYVISCHGATIYGPKGDNPDRPLVKSWPLTRELLRSAVTIAQTTDTLLMFYTTDSIWSCGRADDNLTFRNYRGEPMGEWWARIGEFPVPVEGHPVFEELPSHLKQRVLSSTLTPGSQHFPTFDELLAHADMQAKKGVASQVFKAVFIAHPDRIDPALTTARNMVPPSDGYVMGPFEGWFEMIHPDVNKAVAIEWLGDSVGTTIDHAVTLGDGMNDLDMLRRGGLSIAVANAVSEAKQAADFVSRLTNVESAVAHELRRLVDAGMLPK